jgi:MFS family permease
VVGIGGPPVGGALFSLARFAPFAADAVSYAGSFTAIAAMRTPFQQPREVDPAPVRSQVADGFRFLWREPFLRATTFLYGVGNFTIPAFLFVLVVVARRHGFTGGQVGLLLALFSAALLVGSLLSPLVRRRLSLRAIMLLELFAGPVALVYTVWPNPFVLAAALLPQALVLPITDSVVISRRIAITPDELLGRVEAARMTFARLMQPLGPLVAGLLLAAVSSRLTVFVFGAVSAGLAVCGTAARGLRV